MRTAEILKVPGVRVDIGTSVDTNRPDEAGDMDWAFGLAAPDVSLFAQGLERRLPPGPIDTLAARARAFFEALPEPDGGDPRPRLLVGALPFDRRADDMLFLPRQVSNAPWPMPGRVAPGRMWSATPQPARADYEAAVVRALAAIDRSRGETDPLTKVVLSRSLKLEAEGPVDPFALWLALRADAAATRFITPIGPGPGGSPRRLVGASPELLVSRTGRRVVSHPLAGSAARSPDLVEDEAAALRLKGSDKDRREHAVVVEAILDSLSPYCRDLSAPDEASLMSTRTMWHLGTPIEGRLKSPETAVTELVAALHPTPAVAGSPRDRAVALIHELEGYDRGFYAGAVGWTNASGDGAWRVSLRCAEVAGRTARLYAGAGVVEGSAPEMEADETSAKFQAVLRALGIDETGRLRPSVS